MSDHPQENPQEQPQSENLWHAPSEQTAWRPVKQALPEPEEASRIVPALPDDLPTVSASGEWHLPAPEDTQFVPGDEVPVRPQSQVPEPVRPEDLLNEIVGAASRLAPSPRPEDVFDYDEDGIEGGEPDAELPEDMTFEPGDTLEATEEAAQPPEDEAQILDEDDDAFSFSEYHALRSLDDGTLPDDTVGLDEFDTGELSPAQAAAMTGSGPITASEPEEGESAAEYARRMAEQYAQQGEASLEDTLGQPSQTEQLDAVEAGEDPAEYARRMAEQYAASGQYDPYSQYDQGVMEPGQPLSHEALDQLDPVMQELQRRFLDTRDAVAVLRQQYQVGQIDWDTLQMRLRDYTILDNENNWWMVGLESDNWYRFDTYSNQWVEDVPPVPLPPPGDPRLTETGDLDPSQVMAGSLPYLPDDEASGYSSGEGTPLPNPNQPYTDPDATFVGGAYDRTTLSNSAPTQENLRVLDQTMPSAAVDGPPQADFDERIENPDDAPPDFAQDVAAPIYEQEQQEQRAATGRLVLFVTVALVACGIISAILGFVGVNSWYDQQVEPYRAAIAALADYEPEFQTARILDAESNVIANLNSGNGGARTQVSLEDISPFAIHAVVSAENASFYEDPGFAFDRILGAFLQNIGAGEVVSGASTITQQVARNLVLQDREVTADRKITEILVAMEIARNYSKNEILQLYLNESFFGNQSYGIEAAAEFYFDKSADELNMAEGALLAGLLPAPSANDPVVNQEEAFRSARNVIRRMAEVGCLDFQHGQWSEPGVEFCVGPDVTVAYEGQSGPIVRITSDGSIGGVVSLQLARDVIGIRYEPRDSEIQNPHFVNYVQALLEQEYGADALFSRGFTITTTLIPRIQETATEGLQARVASLRNNGVTTGAVMVTDPRSGAIRAMVGSPDFNDETIAGQVDNTRTLQQPGSAIKPIVYIGALEGGPAGYLTPASILWDVPSTYQSPDGSVYQPVNFSGTFGGPIPLRYALQRSVNVPAVKALEFIGLEKFVQTAERMQLRFDERTQFSLASALGANDVRLIDMMKAYGIIANNGVYAPLYAIESITEEIEGVESPVPVPPVGEEERVLTPQVAYVMQNILSDDQARQPQFPANSPLTLVNAGLPTQDVVGAKTGTSNGGRDLWTMGFTNNTVTGVWLGTFDDAQTVDLTGFIAAAPLWNQVMSSAVSGRQPGRFSNPGGVVQVTICAETGTLVGEGCPTRMTGIAIQTQPPPPPEAGFVQTVVVDGWTGYRANQWCPENQVAQVFANINDPFAVDWINNTAEGRAYAARINLPLPLQPPPAQECNQGQVLPTIDIVNPANGETISGEITITGQISAPNLNRWELQLAPVNTENFVLISEPASNEVPSRGSALYTWDTRAVNNGTYILRLAAYSNSGGFIFDDRQITIENIPPTPTPTPTIAPTPFPTAGPPPVSPTSPGGITPLPWDDPTPTATLGI